MPYWSSSVVWGKAASARHCNEEDRVAPGARWEGFPWGSRVGSRKSRAGGGRGIPHRSGLRSFGYSLPFPVACAPGKSHRCASSLSVCSHSPALVAHTHAMDIHTAARLLVLLPPHHTPGCWAGPGQCHLSPMALSQQMWVKLGSRCPFVRRWTHFTVNVGSQANSVVSLLMTCPWAVKGSSVLFSVLSALTWQDADREVLSEGRMEDCTEKGFLPPHGIPIFWEITHTIGICLCHECFIMRCYACSAETSPMGESIREGLFDQRSLGCSSQICSTLDALRVPSAD